MPGLGGTDTIAYLPNIDEKLNACRIVAAVNSFQGISTEVLIQAGAVMAPKREGGSVFWLFGPEEPDEYGNCMEDRQILWEKDPELYKRLYWSDASD